MSHVARAETSRRQWLRNVIYIELRGYGSFYAASYQRPLPAHLALRIEGGYVALSATHSASAEETASVAFLWMPLELRYLGVRKHQHCLELGAGVVPIYSWALTSPGTALVGTGLRVGFAPSVAYRRLARHGELLVEFAFAPLIGSFGLVPSVSLGVGLLQ